MAAFVCQQIEYRICRGVIGLAWRTKHRRDRGKRDEQIERVGAGQLV
jgi:hypothetical protein